MDKKNIILISNKERNNKKQELRKEWNELKKQIKSLTDIASVEKLSKHDTFLRLLDNYQAVNVELCRYDLAEFVAQTWKPITGEDFVHAWYIDVICDHMELLYDLEFQKLIISIAPRSGKSTILSQIYPVWLWLQDPRNKILTVSYRKDLSGRDARASRDLINGDWFQNNWGHLFEWSKDQNLKSYYENKDGGNRMGLSVGAPPTGFGYHYICMDDINAATEANSPAKLRAATEYYDGALRTRWQKPETFRQVCLQQRISMDDLSGYLQREYTDWVVLKLPEEYTGVKLIGHRGVDQRDTVGQLLKPKLFSRAFVEEEKKNLFKWEAQFQQNPVPPGGAYIKADDLRYWTNSGVGMRPALELFDSIFSSTDLSDGSIDETSSYCCYLIIGIIGAKFYVLDIVMEKHTFPDQLDTIIKLKKQWRTRFDLIELGSNGRALSDYLLREYRTLFDRIELIPPREYGGDKFTRFSQTLPVFMENKVWLPDKTVHAKSEKVKQQLLTFPKSLNNDFVDALSQAINYVMKNDFHRSGGMAREYAVDMRDEMPTIGVIDESFEAKMGELRSELDLCEVGSLFKV
jgi:predicted phage terminase large subunit-like protein